MSRTLACLRRTLRDLLPEAGERVVRYYAGLCEELNGTLDAVEAARCQQAGKSALAQLEAIRRLLQWAAATDAPPGLPSDSAPGRDVEATDLKRTLRQVRAELHRIGDGR